MTADMIMPEGWAPVSPDKQSEKENVNAQENENKFTKRNGLLAERNKAVDDYNEKSAKGKNNENNFLYSTYSKVNELFYHYQVQYYQEAFNAKNKLNEGVDLTEEQALILEAVKQEADENFQKICGHPNGTKGWRDWLLVFYRKNQVNDIMRKNLETIKDPNEIVANYEDEFVAMRFKRYQERYDNEGEKRKWSIARGIKGTMNWIRGIKEEKN
jgi:hypothetical protein